MRLSMIREIIYLERYQWLILCCVPGMVLRAFQEVEFVVPKAPVS